MTAQAVEPVEAFKRWLLERGYSRRSLKHYLWSARQVRLDLPPAEALARLEYELRTLGHSPAAIPGYLSAAKTFLRHRCLLPEHSKPGADPIWDAYRNYLSFERGMRESTVKHYLTTARYLEAITQELGTCSAKCTKQHLAQALQLLRAGGAAPTTVHNYLVGFRHYLEFLRSNSIRADNPAQDMRVPNPYQPLPKALDVEVVIKLLDSVPPGPEPLEMRNRAILELLACSGLRASEVCSLKLQDLDFSRLDIRLVGKGGRPRLAFFSQRCANYLKKYIADARPKLANSGEEHLFVNRWGKLLTSAAVWSIVTSRARAIGIQCSPHVLRHSLATALLEQGVNLRYIQQILGHVRLATTEIYTYVRPNKLASIYHDKLPIT